jgi:branched-chain amino acid transport system substrate-binding protein
MYQDSDFGRDVMAGAEDQLKAMNVTLVASTAHKPTDTDFNGPIAKLRDANCDLILLGTIVRDTNIILSTVRKIGWNVDLMGQSASYDTSIATAPGGAAEGFYSMTKPRQAGIRTFWVKPAGRRGSLFFLHWNEPGAT